ncbi:hypothetical protein BJ875DRAFT_485167 [Amylocarpus encephaloides]|uniref:Uncharacterized protein n=1 Tax=Amylocarpus encephaloides TaxID=45428 RepID=A0A9P7YGT3_9HELO|nr:hypothetical protein BJ875DRAFT_485167 [Amylocarpus encephaloides]
MAARTSDFQVIEGHFMDQRKLISKLKDVYGENNFRVELRLNRYKIYPSETFPEKRPLSPDDIQACRVQRRRGY